MSNNFFITIDDKTNQASGYPSIMSFIRPDKSTYHQGINCDYDTNNSNDNVIVNNIMKKYSGAWEKLADL